MATQGPAGTTAFDRLRDRLDRERRRCPACGRNAGGTWRADTSGDRVRYRRRCPGCGNEESRELRI